MARARAGEALTRLDVQTAVGTAFLNIVGAQRAVAALQADVDRRDLLSRAVHTLVDNQLRPGAEASRSDAERAAAQTRLIQAQQAVTLAQITLARVLGVTTGPVTIDATTLVDRLPADAPAAGAADASAHTGPPSRRRRRSGARGHSVADGFAACVRSVECVRARQRRECRMGSLTAGSRASVSIAPTGRPACRWCFPTRSTSRACALGRPPRRHRRASKPRCTTRRCSRSRVSSRRRLRWCRLRAPSPRIRRCSSRRRSRAKRRPARAIRRAWRALSKWPMRRACSRKPKCRTSSRGSTSGAPCWRRRPRTAR